MFNVVKLLKIQTLAIPKDAVRVSLRQDVLKRLPKLAVTTQYQNVHWWISVTGLFVMSLRELKSPYHCAAFGTYR